MSKKQKTNNLHHTRKIGVKESGASQTIVSSSPLWDTVLKYTFFPLLLLMVIIFLCACPIEEYDIWFHMGFARYVLQHKAFPPGDIFSFTSPGREWISTGWLASIILYWLWEMIGHGQNTIGLAFFVVAQVLVAYFVIYIAAARRQVHAAMTLFLLGSLLTAVLRLNPRPDLCSQLLISLVLLLLITSEKMAPRPFRVSYTDKWQPPTIPMPGWGRLWALPPLILLWVNLHVGFLVGVMVVAIYAAHRLWRWFKGRDKNDLLALVPCALCGIIWLVNPYGIRVLSLPSKIKSVPGVTEMLFEWMPFIIWNGQNLPYFIFIGMGFLLAFYILTLILRTTRLPWWHLVTAAFFVVITWNARRQMAITALAIPILALPHLEGINRILTRNRFLVPALTAAGALILSGMQLTGHLVGATGWPTMKLNITSFPIGATQFLKVHRPPANMFNSYHFGGYLLYYLGPETKVFIDGRIDTYDPAIWVDDRAIEAGTLSIDEACRRYHLNTFVLDKRPQFDPGNLVQRIAMRPDMKIVYDDLICAVFVRLSPETEEYLKSLPQ